jgi:hypothetical protein
MAWLSLCNDDYRNSQMCTVTGLNQDIAIKLIKRMKGLFEHTLGITFANKETVLELKKMLDMFLNDTLENQIPLL